MYQFFQVLTKLLNTEFLLTYVGPLSIDTANIEPPPYSFH